MLSVAGGAREDKSMRRKKKWLKIWRGKARGLVVPIVSRGKRLEGYSLSWLKLKMLRGSMIRNFDRISVEEEIGIGLDGFRAVGVRRFQAPTWPDANTYIPAKPLSPNSTPRFNQPDQNDRDCSKDNGSYTNQIFPPRIEILPQFRLASAC